MKERNEDFGERCIGCTDEKLRPWDTTCRNVIRCDWASLRKKNGCDVSPMPPALRKLNDVLKRRADKRVGQLLEKSVVKNALAWGLIYNNWGMKNRDSKLTLVSVSLLHALDKLDRFRRGVLWPKKST